jgi:hypothetical protein
MIARVRRWLRRWRDCNEELDAGYRVSPPTYRGWGYFR